MTWTYIGMGWVTAISDRPTTIAPLKVVLIISTFSDFGQSGAKKGRVSEYRVLQSLSELADSR